MIMGLERVDAVTASLSATELAAPAPTARHRRPQTTFAVTGVT
jgi:hypothetical protein